MTDRGVRPDPRAGGPGALLRGAVTGQRRALAGAVLLLTGLFTVLTAGYRFGDRSPDRPTPSYRR